MGDNSKRIFMRCLLVRQAPQAAEIVVYSVIPSGARNLSSIFAQVKKERFLAPLGMTAGVFCLVSA
jgi:hypothetical protein